MMFLFAFDFQQFLSPMYLDVALIFILFGVGRISYIFGFLAHQLFFSLTVTFYKIVFFLAEGILKNEV